MTSNDMNSMISEISVVVCAKNAENTLEKSLKSVTKNRIKEIVLVDGRSTDNTIEIGRKYTNKIYQDEGKGLAYARQLGAEKARGKYIAYIDSDTELPNEFVLPTLIKELEEKNWGAVHAQLIDPRETKTYWEGGEDFHWRFRFNTPGERKSLGTIVCLIRRELILEYKFDKFFRGAAEDGDFYIRIRKGGSSIGVSTTTAYHYHRASFNSFVTQRIWYGKGNARIIWKYHSILLLFAPLMIILWGTCVSLIYKTKLAPFYIIWGCGLLIGTILGFLELLSDSIIDRS